MDLLSCYPDKRDVLLLQPHPSSSKMSAVQQIILHPYLSQTVSTQPASRRWRWPGQRRDRWREERREIPPARLSPSLPQGSTSSEALKQKIHRSSLDLISNFSIDSDFASSGTHQLRFWSTTVGRDKTYRTIQYIARFLAWYEYRKGATKETVARLTALKSSLGLSRKREWSDLIWSRGEDW